MTSSAPHHSEPKSVYNDKALDSRIKLKRYALTLAEGIKHPKNSQFGKTILPMGNMTPLELSMETELLPHTQLKTQNFLSINPSETKPQQPPKVAMVAYTPRKITVPVLRVNSLDTENVITMLAAFSCPFFYEKFTPYECTNIDIIRAWCSLYGAIDRDFGTAVANTGLDMANCRVVIEDYNDAATFMDAYTAEMPMFGTHLAKIEEHGIAGDTSLMVIMCVLCQTAGKFVYADNYTKWYTNRAKAASGLIGGCNLDNVIAAIPTMNGLQTGYNALGSVFEFRRMIVDRMFVYSEGRSVISRLFGLTLQMLASTELTHVYNIDLYIMKLAPEIMNLHILRAYDDQLVDMYKFWVAHKDIFPYVRFYVDPKECHCLNRNVLMPLIIASHSVATYMSDTFKNYKGPSVNSTMYKDVSDIVGRYLQARKDAGGLALGSSDRAVATEVERDYILNLASGGEEAAGTTQLARDLAEALADNS